MVCFPGDLGGSVVSLGKGLSARHMSRVATLETQAETATCRYHVHSLRLLTPKMPGD